MPCLSRGLASFLLSLDPPGGPAVAIGSRFTGDAEGAPLVKDNPEENIPLDGVSLWETRLEQVAEVSLCSRGCPRPTEVFLHHRWPLAMLRLISSACQEVDRHVTDCVTITKRFLCQPLSHPYRITNVWYQRLFQMQTLLASSVLRGGLAGSK